MTHQPGSRAAPIGLQSEFQGAPTRWLPSERTVTSQKSAPLTQASSG